MNGKYCFKWGEDYSKAVRNSDDPEVKAQTHKETGEPKGYVHMAIKELCVFQALQGEKSHWFRFMDTLINGCVVKEKINNPFSPPKPNEAVVKVVTSSCFDKAV